MSCLIILNGMDKTHGLMYLIMGLCGAWLADSGAYFAGTFFGKHKLCPEVSPKKTVEGFIGGIVVTGLLFMLINFGYSKILPLVTDSTVSVNYFEVCLLGNGSCGCRNYRRSFSVRSEKAVRNKGLWKYYAGTRRCYGQV